MAFLVEAAEQFVDHPVGRRLAIAFWIVEPLDDLLEIVGGGALGDEHASVISRQAVLIHEAVLLFVG
jgi:hypothetical protein